MQNVQLAMSKSKVKEHQDYMTPIKTQNAVLFDHLTICLFNDLTVLLNRELTRT
jgi:hypothetical protein